MGGAFRLKWVGHLDLNGWDIYSLDGWGSYGKVSYCFFGEIQKHWSSGQLLMSFICSIKVEIYRDSYHNHQILLLPYKVTVESVACLWGILVAQSNLYQRTHVKSVPEK